LDLTDPLAGDPEGPPHFLERQRFGPTEAVTQFDHLALALRQRVERTPYALLLQVLARFLERLEDGIVGDEIAELRFVLVAHWFLQRDRQLRHPQDVAD